MSDDDKGANQWVAQFLTTELKLKEGSKTLDIGAKYPYLAHCLRVNHGMESYAMDNIEIVDEYAASLNVPMLQADFEKIDKKQIEEWTKTKKFDLITMVHCFEHMYKPLEALKKLRALVADDGHLYIRSPDHNVSGFERDLTDNHYTIHPFFHSNVSLLQCLVEVKDLFVIERYIPCEGFGQADWFLKPIKRKPMIVAGMIVKNEERDLPKCLKSIARVVDSVVIVDTGSTDNTEKVAKNTIYNPIHYSHYHGASKQDETGDWKLWDFGKARNQFVEKVEALDADWCLWMDADDILLNQENLLRACYWTQNQVYGLNIKSGGALWIHHRLWQTKNGVIFEGRCHEYPKMDNLSGMNLTDVVIEHDAAPGNGETSNARNLRILEEEFADHPTSTRCAFYLANTHSDGGRPAQAVEIYTKRIELGEGYRDEMLFAYLYKARNLRVLERKDDAIKCLLQAIAIEPTWAEFWMELAYIYGETGQHWKSVGMAMQALNMPQPYTQLWREKDKYTDQPLRMLSWGYQNLNRIKEALEWALSAKVAIGVPDADWDKRISELEQMLKTTANKVAFWRPGAIGDVIMTLNLVRTFKAKFPNTQVHYYTETHGLEEIMAVAGIDAVHYGTPPEGEYAHVFNLIGYPLQEGYPEKPMSKHLLEYFGAELGLRIDPKNLPTINVRKPDPLPIEQGYITIHPQAGWSDYKNWPLDRWEAVIAKFPDLKFYQIGSADDPKLAGAIHTYMGTPLENTIRLMAHARFHLGVDSFTNHLTHINWEGGKTRAAIIWGSTQPTAAGYPHNINICKNLPCSPCFRETTPQSTHPRAPCIMPISIKPNGFALPKCQDDIQVQEVIDAVTILESLTKPTTA
jgi:ADP-heptose:LPS heptosyltransferase/glycosyltransferase involved in cell wall biosynthesis